MNIDIDAWPTMDKDPTAKTHHYNYTSNEFAAMSKFNRPKYIKLRNAVSLELVRRNAAKIVNVADDGLISIEKITTESK